MLEIKKKSSGPNKFPIFLLVLGGLLMFIELWFAKIAGLVLILIGLLTIYATTGVQLDLDNKLYRKFIKLTWFYSGQWLPLPDVEYIAIIRVRLSQLQFKPSQAGFAQNDDKFSIQYNVNLILKDPKQRYLTIYTGDLNDTMETAIDMAKTFKTDLYDCSTSQKQWISLDDINTKH